MTTRTVLLTVIGLLVLLLACSSEPAPTAVSDEPAQEPAIPTGLPSAPSGGSPASTPAVPQATVPTIAPTSPDPTLKASAFSTPTAVPAPANAPANP